MFDKFAFKGCTLEIGDVVTMIASSVPLEFQAAVVGYNKTKDTLEVMSTQLAIFQHNGFFPSGDVKALERICGYEKAIPLQARANLHRGQVCQVTNSTQKARAKVAAAFDGMVTGYAVDSPGFADGSPITNGSRFWKPL